MKCAMLEIMDTENLHCVVGKSVNVDEKVLEEKSKVDLSKLTLLPLTSSGAGTIDLS